MPRAMAHQEHYCLTPAFPACPTFQDWARREALRLASLAGGATAARVVPQDSGEPPVERKAAGEDDYVVQFTHRGGAQTRSLPESPARGR